MQKKYNVMLARFPFGLMERSECVDWLMATALNMQNDPRIARLSVWCQFQVPVTTARNLCVKEALEQDIDIIIMTDCDMGPDRGGGTDKFWPRALEFIESRWDVCPTVIGAAYCGKPPEYAINAFRWRARDPEFPYFKVFYREEAADRVGSGYEAVAAMGTGLVAIDTRIFTGYEGYKLPKPYFYYEYNEDESKVISTEDVVFTRNANEIFREVAPVVFCDWNAWASHLKIQEIMRPVNPKSPELLRVFRREAEEKVRQEAADGISPGNGSK